MGSRLKASLETLVSIGNHLKSDARLLQELANSISEGDDERRRSAVLALWMLLHRYELPVDPVAIGDHARCFGKLGSGLIDALAREDGFACTDALTLNVVASCLSTILSFDIFQRHEEITLKLHELSESLCTMIARSTRGDSLIPLAEVLEVYERILIRVIPEGDYQQPLDLLLMLLRLSEKLYFDEIVRKKCLSMMKSVILHYGISGNSGAEVGYALSKSRIVDMICFTAMLETKESLETLLLLLEKFFVPNLHVFPKDRPYTVAVCLIGVYSNRSMKIDCEVVKLAADLVPHMSLLEKAVLAKKLSTKLRNSPLQIKKDILVLVSKLLYDKCLAKAFLDTGALKLVIPSALEYADVFPITQRLVILCLCSSLGENIFQAFPMGLIDFIIKGCSPDVPSEVLVNSLKIIYALSSHWDSCAKALVNYGIISIIKNVADKCIASVPVCNLTTLNLVLLMFKSASFKDNGVGLVDGMEDLHSRHLVHLLEGITRLRPKGQSFDRDSTSKLRIVEFVCSKLSSTLIMCTSGHLESLLAANNDLLVGLIYGIRLLLNDYFTDTLDLPPSVHASLVGFGLKILMLLGSFDSLRSSIKPMFIIQALNDTLRSKKPYLAAAAFEALCTSSKSLGYISQLKYPVMNICRKLDALSAFHRSPPSLDLKNLTLDDIKAFLLSCSLSNVVHSSTISSNTIKSLPVLSSPSGRWVYNPCWRFLPHVYASPKHEHPATPASFSVVVRLKSSFFAMGWCSQEVSFDALYHNVNDKRLCVAYISTEAIRDSGAVIESLFNPEVVLVKLGDTVTSYLHKDFEVEICVNGVKRFQKTLDSSWDPLKYPIVIIPENSACEITIPPASSSLGGSEFHENARTERPCKSCDLNSDAFCTPPFSCAYFNEVTHDSGSLILSDRNAATLIHATPIKLTEQHSRSTLTSLTEYENIHLEFRIGGPSVPESCVFGVHDGQMRAILFENTLSSRKLESAFVHNVSGILSDGISVDPYTPLKIHLAECKCVDFEFGDILSIKSSKLDRRLAVFKNGRIVGGFTLTGNFEDFRYPIIVSPPLAIDITSCNMGFPHNVRKTLESPV